MLGAPSPVHGGAACAVLHRTVYVYRATLRPSELSLVTGSHLAHRGLVWCCAQCSLRAPLARVSQLLPLLRVLP